MAQHTEGPRVYKWEHYLPIYERHFGRFVDHEVRVVEVGIYRGGSLPMWLDYFGADAHIYGVDIQEGCRAFASDRTSVFIGDQGDARILAGFLACRPENRHSDR